MKNFPIKNISRNVFSYTTGQAISLIINVISIGLAARYIGVENFGVFSYLLAIVIIFTKMMDLGITPIIFRESSVEKNFRLLNTGIILRLLLFALLIIVFNLTTLITHFDKEEIILSNILFFSLIISSKGTIRDLLEIPFKVDLRIHLTIIITVFDNLVFLLLIILMPHFKGGLFYFVLAYVFSNLPGFILMAIIINKNYKFSLRLNLDDSKWLIKKSLPIFSYVILSSLFQQIDLLVLKYFDSSYATGLYSAAIRLITPLVIIPTAIIHTVFPIITYNYSTDPGKNNFIIKFVFKILLFISFSLAAIISFKSQAIVVLIYGSNFSAAASPIIILFWSQVFMFYSFFVINLLVAYDKQKSIYTYSIVILIMNLLLDIILIPKFSIEGVAWAKFIAIFLGFLITIYVINQHDKSIYLSDFKNLIFSLSILLVCFFSSFLQLFPYLILTSLFLFIITIVLRYFSSKEIKIILKMINKENWTENYFLNKYLE